MKIRRILFAIGCVLIIGGLGVMSWFFYQNKVSEKKMLKYTVEFMETLEEIPEDEPPQKYLEGNTISVLEFPVFDNERIAVKEGTTDYILSIAAGHMKETEQVWDASGTCAIAAHNNTFFKNLKNFKIGDKIIVYTRHGVFEYEVYSKKTISPTDLSVLDDVKNQKNLTLITCDFSGTKRIVVIAKGGIRVSEAKDV